MNNILLSLSLVLYSIFLAIILKRISNFYKSVAMIFSFIGDMILAHFWIFENSLFVYGALFFCISHIFYIVAYLYKIKNKLFNKGFLVGLFFCLLIILNLLIFYYKNPQSLFMLILSIVYGLVIGFLCCIVSSCFYNNKNILSFLNFIGILFFIISDFLIGINIVGGVDFPNRGKLIWIFYPLGQFLLILDWKKLGE